MIRDFGWELLYKEFYVYKFFMVKIVNSVLFFIIVVKVSIFYFV